MWPCYILGSPGLQIAASNGAQTVQPLGPAGDRRSLCGLRARQQLRVTVMCGAVQIAVTLCRGAMDVYEGQCDKVRGQDVARDL